jgi:hypothetical protein
MGMNPGEPWGGYAPMAVKDHKYAVRHHGKVGWRVSCRMSDPDSNVELTLFAPQAAPEIEALFPQGGPFAINEWKQVLRPEAGVGGGRQVTFLGEFPGLHLRFSYQGRIYDGAATDGLTPGDPWPHHEAGVPYQYDLNVRQLSRQIEVQEEWALVARKEVLANPPSVLLEGLRAADPKRAAGRLYVNEHGAVFLPPTQDRPRPIFAGRIDVEKDEWFPKHEG